MEVGNGDLRVENGSELWEEPGLIEVLIKVLVSL